MNVASENLSQELFELSGWSGTVAYYKKHGGITINLITGRPAYDLGYLLRKLKITADWTHGRFDLENYCEDGTYMWSARYNDYGEDAIEDQHADNPEDAAAKLCICLIKRGILTP